MSQHDMNIANQGFPAFRSDLNNALVALASLSSGSTAPSSPTTYQLWLDTSGGPTAHVLKFYDGSDWIALFTINATANTAAPAVADNSLALGKLANIASSRLLGRYDAGSGAPQEIQLGAGLSFSGGALIASAAHGQCRLIKSGANLLLKPYNGNKLIIDGVARDIPAAGVSLAPTGATPSTLYYIYAYWSGGAMALEYSATGHSTQSTTGVETKTGDTTRTLVGMAMPVTGPAWQDSDDRRYVVGYFNRRPLQARNAFASNRNTASTSFVEMSSTERAGFLTWADDAARIKAQNTNYNSSIGEFHGLAVGLDNTSPIYSAVEAEYVVDGSTGRRSETVSDDVVPGEGVHYATILGRTTGGTLTMVGGALGAPRTTIQVAFWG